MGKRTVSNLSRETAVSRQTIYKKIRELNISYNGAEFMEADYNTLKKKLTAISNINKSKSSLPPVEEYEEKRERLESNEQSTLKERLKKAKEQYNFYDDLIQKFHAEIDEYFRINKKTTIMTHNGTESSIPAIISLEKHVKLNIALSKLISELESRVDADNGGEENPFV